MSCLRFVSLFVERLRDMRSASDGRVAVTLWHINDHVTGIDTGPTSPCTDPITQGRSTWLSVHKCVSHRYDSIV